MIDEMINLLESNSGLFAVYVIGCGSSFREFFSLTVLNHTVHCKIHTVHHESPFTRLFQCLLSKAL